MNRTRIQLLLWHILSAPLLTWVLMGFSMSYLLFFVNPIFFSAQVMQFFRYVPAINPIGTDLKYMLSYSESWFVAKQTPYIANNLYPPLATILFTPLLFIDFSWAYKILTLVNVACYVMITLVFPIRAGKERQVSSLLILVFITGLFSYGFQFELERGQFNVIAVFICFLAIWIYHYHNKYRYLGYILFSISVQLKVYPIIFLVMLISDWHDWRNNIKRLLILATVNFVLFFALGPHIFVDFIIAIKSQAANPYIWVGNHSISSFVVFGSYPSPELTQFVLLALVAVCIFSIMLQVYRQNQKDINPYLIFACTIGALLIPSVSNDYKLSILAAPVAILFSNDRFSERANSPYMHLIYIVVMLIFSVAYSSTLISYTNKPILIQNNFLALVTMLLAITFLSFVFKPPIEGVVSEPL